MQPTCFCKTGRKTPLLLRHQATTLILCMLMLFSSHLYGQRKVEKLGRGVVAVNTGGGKAYISWRLLASDPDDIAFNLYRTISGTTVKLNTTPITTTTDFSDNSASTTASNQYFVKPIINGVEQGASKAFSLAGSSTAKRYISIPLQPLAHYSVQHIYPADLDGDGEYDYIVKRLPADSHNNVMIEAYNNDGTFMWRADLGPNIEQGAPTHNPIVLAYDFDGDGKAEVLVRSSEGTVFADGTTIPDVNGDGVSDYRTFPAVSLGYMLLGDNCPEFLSMVDGMTGKEITRTNWIDRGRKSEWETKWGDSYGHRMSMQFIGVVYLDGIHPSIFGSRGPGELMDVAAWDYANKQFTSRWTWSARNNTTIPTGYHWADFHNIRIADLDGDGKDEISFGVNAMDDNGTPLYYAKNDIGHGDRFVIADLDPSRPGLECYAIQQATSVLAVLYDAKNGERLKTWSSASPFDVSRGDAADIDSRYPGMELWSYAHTSILDCKGNAISGSTVVPHPALSIWWDGDLLRENLDAADGDGYNPIINKWNNTTNSFDRLLSMYSEGGAYSTKTPYAGRAALYGDIMGDWREEVFCMNGDSTEIRIFSTWTPATNRLYCLMQNPEYRACIGPKGYLPSTEVDYYLGAGMTAPPTPPVLTAQSQWAGGLNSNTWDIHTTSNWKHNDAASIYTEGDTIMFDISGTGNTAINLNINVNPGYMIANTPVDYSITGTGSLTGATRLLKSGQGALSLSVNCDYTGKTKVEQGALYINSTLSQSVATIYKDAGIGGSGTITNPVTFITGSKIIPGPKGAVGTIHFSAGLSLPGKNSLLFDITDDATGISKPSDKIAVTGDLVINDTTYLVINKINGTVNPGTYPLITYTGTFTGNLSNIIISGLYGQKAILSNSTGVISLTVFATRGAEKITWSGTGALWDLFTSINWLHTETPEVFVTGDTVIFNATGSGQYNVNVAESVSIGDMTVDASSNDFAFAGSGAIGGTGGLTKTGAGTLTMANANIFTGKIAINGGVLQISNIATAGNPSAIGASTDTVPGNIIFSNASLKFTGTGASNTTDRGITISNSDTIEISAATTAQLGLTGRVAGTGSLVKTGPGILLLQPSSKNTYTGNATIKAGTISFGSLNGNEYGFGASTNTVILDGGTWSMYNNTNTSYGNTTWNISVPSGSTGSLKAASRCTLTGSLTGGGALTYYTPYVRAALNGNWSAFTGSINVTTDADGGDFRVNNTYGYVGSSINLNNLVYAYYAGTTASAGTTMDIGELSGTSGSFLQGGPTGGRTFTWRIGAKNTNATFNGIIKEQTAGITAITKIGTGSWTLTNANTYTGKTTINGGTLMVNNTSGSGTGTGAVAVNTGATLAGTGIITGTVTVASGATIAPGTNSIGTLTINNNTTLQSGSNTSMEVNKTTGTNDQLVVTGTLTLGGTLTISNLGSDFAPGDNFKIINAITTSGSFSSISPATPGTGMAWDVSALSTTGILKVIGTQTITFGSLAAKTVIDAPFVLSATASSGLTVTFSSSNPSVATVNGNIVTIVAVGNTIITASQAGNSAYNAAADVQQTLVVNPDGRASQSITFDALTSKTYGDADFSVAASSTSGLGVTLASSNSQVATIQGNTVTITGVGSATITASQSGDDSYKPATDIQQTLTVQKAMVTVTAVDTFRTKGMSNPVFRLTYAGFVKNESISNLKTLPTAICSADANSNAGNYDILVSGGDDEKYDFTYVQGKLSVREVQTITFDNLSPKCISDAPFTLSATATSGLAVTYTSSNPSVASVNGNIVTMVSPGSTIITASQTGNNLYAPAADVAQTFVVNANKASQSITFSTLSTKTYGDADFNILVSATSGLGVTLVSSNTQVATFNGNTVTIVGAGTTTITASQSGNDAYLPATTIQQLIVQKAMLTVTAVDTFRTKGMPNPVFRLTYAGFVKNENVSDLKTLPIATCSADVNSVAGNYDILVSGGDDNKYDFTYNKGKLTVILNTSTSTVTDNGISVYPNPAQDKITIYLSDLKEKTQIIINTLNGNQVYSTKASQPFTEINMSNFTQGTYIIQVISPKGIYIKQIVKM
jgi:fibronectin-binding autotransporter adhesin